jgi:hypothetical protein
MKQLILNINDTSKTEVLIHFLKTLNYVSIDETNEKKAVLSKKQKLTLDERRQSTSKDEYVSWKEMKKKLKLKSK